MSLSCLGFFSAKCKGELIDLTCGVLEKFVRLMKSQNL